MLKDPDKEVIPMRLFYAVSYFSYSSLFIFITFHITFHIKMSQAAPPSQVSKENAVSESGNGALERDSSPATESVASASGKYSRKLV
jgi:hypothetical protein